MNVARPRPRQGTAGQLIDVLFLLVILFGTLFVTTFVFAPDESTDEAATTGTASVRQLPISNVEKVQYERMVQLGVSTDDDVRAAVEANAPRADKYSFTWASLVGTVGLTLVYLLIVYRLSFKEYREVIAARFGATEREDG